MKIYSEILYLIDLFLERFQQLGLDASYLLELILFNEADVLLALARLAGCHLFLPHFFNPPQHILTDLELLED